MSSKSRPRCFFDVKIDDKEVGRIIFELFSEKCPKTCENFRSLCTGECGSGLTTYKKLHYKGCCFHRVVKDFMIQGGDFSEGNGTGGESIYGGCFPDENFDLKHDRPYLLSMANRGRDTNGSQFFITTAPAPHLDGIHVVFGQVITGQNLIKQIENLPVDTNNRPKSNVTISHAGQLVLVKKNEKSKKRKKDTGDSENRRSRSDSSSSSSSSSSSTTVSETSVDESATTTAAVIAGTNNLEDIGDENDEIPPKTKKEKKKLSKKKKKKEKHRKKKKYAKKLAKLAKLNEQDDHKGEEDPLQELEAKKKISNENEVSGREMMGLKTMIDPEEVPEIPTQKFLLRNVGDGPAQQQDQSDQDKQTSYNDTNQRQTRTQRYDRYYQKKDANGRPVKGRGNLRYTGRSHSRSITPPHWRSALRDRVRLEERKNEMITSANNIAVESQGSANISSNEISDEHNQSLKRPYSRTNTEGELQGQRQHSSYENQENEDVIEANLSKRSKRNESFSKTSQKQSIPSVIRRTSQEKSPPKQSYHNHQQHYRSERGDRDRHHHRTSTRHADDESTNENNTRNTKHNEKNKPESSKEQAGTTTSTNIDAELSNIAKSQQQSSSGNVRRSRSNSPAAMDHRRTDSSRGTKDDRYQRKDSSYRHQQDSREDRNYPSSTANNRKESDSHHRSSYRSNREKERDRESPKRTNRSPYHSSSSRRYAEHRRTPSPSKGDHGVRKTTENKSPAKQQHQQQAQVEPTQNMISNNSTSVLSEENTSTDPSRDHVSSIIAALREVAHQPPPPPPPPPSAPVISNMQVPVQSATTKSRSRWENAEDFTFRQIVASATVLASATAHHTSDNEMSLEDELRMIAKSSGTSAPTVAETNLFHEIQQQPIYREDIPVKYSEHEEPKQKTNKPIDVSQTKSPSSTTKSKWDDDEEENYNKMDVQVHPARTEEKVQRPQHEQIFRTKSPQRSEKTKSMGDSDVGDLDEQNERENKNKPEKLNVSEKSEASSKRSRNNSSADKYSPSKKSHRSRSKSPPASVSKESSSKVGKSTTPSKKRDASTSSTSSSNSSKSSTSKGSKASDGDKGKRAQNKSSPQKPTSKSSYRSDRGDRDRRDRDRRSRSRNHYRSSYNSSSSRARNYYDSGEFEEYSLLKQLFEDEFARSSKVLLSPVEGHDYDRGYGGGSSSKRYENSRRNDYGDRYHDDRHHSDIRSDRHRDKDYERDRGRDRHLDRNDRSSGRRRTSSRDRDRRTDLERKGRKSSTSTVEKNKNVEKKPTLSHLEQMTEQKPVSDGSSSSDSSSRSSSSDSSASSRESPNHSKRDSDKTTTEKKGKEKLSSPHHKHGSHHRHHRSNSNEDLKTSKKSSDSTTPSKSRGETEIFDTDYETAQPRIVQPERKIRIELSFDKQTPHPPPETPPSSPPPSPTNEENQQKLHTLIDPDVSFISTTTTVTETTTTTITKERYVGERQDEDMELSDTERSPEQQHYQRKQERIHSSPSSEANVQLDSEFFSNDVSQPKKRQTESNSHKQSQQLYSSDNENDNSMDLDSVPLPTDESNRIKNDESRKQQQRSRNRTSDSNFSHDRKEERKQRRSKTPSPSPRRVSKQETKPRQHLSESGEEQEIQRRHQHRKADEAIEKSEQVKSNTDSKQNEISSNRSSKHADYSQEPQRDTKLSNTVSSHQSTKVDVLPSNKEQQQHDKPSQKGRSSRSSSASSSSSSSSHSSSGSNLFCLNHVCFEMMFSASPITDSSTGYSSNSTSDNRSTTTMSSATNLSSPTTPSSTSTSTSSSYITRPRILLTGLRRSGKTSIQKVIFNKMQPLETKFLESTKQMLTTDFTCGSFINFQLQEIPGQLSLFKDQDTLNIERLLKQCNAVVYIIDAQDDYQESIQRLILIIQNGHRVNPRIRYEIFIHKVDGLVEDTKIETQRDIHNQVCDRLEATNNRAAGINNTSDGQISSTYLDAYDILITFHLTSIFDHSIFEAFSKVVQKLLPQFHSLERCLNLLLSSSNIEQAFLFDVQTKISIANDSSPTDMQMYELCCDMIDLLLDLSNIYGLPPNKERAANDSPVESDSEDSAYPEEPANFWDQHGMGNGMNGDDDDLPQDMNYNSHNGNSPQTESIDDDIISTTPTQPTSARLTPPTHTGGIVHHTTSAPAFSVFDSMSSSIIKLTGGRALYLKEINRHLALICILREEALTKQAIIDYNVKQLKKAIINIFKLNSKGNNHNNQNIIQQDMTDIIN
ncbi:unnamed protein product [Didymodactylos carnosus]|uniref:peptidylprolyl isomerase n=1 Tax=Didymodactylos carnosus TaxID=1234261 RepID=A0A813XWK6_9BILA|nr:unnamed protein product [Didymodactylos carnosus]CAF0876714.1 unnamed protein product [Didymodactylos carnosus]CAF3542035.1 unnamed protein product [Didymodactylos carnosus]CAF3663499.1 unnamed protein product [Didymodactylos carnosus]